MNWLLIYRILVGVGVAVIVASLAFSGIWFFFFLVLGGVLAAFSLVELASLGRGQKKPVLTPASVSPSFLAASDVSLKAPLALAQPSAQRPPATHTSFFSRFLKPFSRTTQREEVAVDVIKGKPTTKQVTPSGDLRVIEQGKKDKDVAVLEAFVRDALKNRFPVEKIREAALQARWPRDTVEDVLGRFQKIRMRAKLMVGVVVFIFVLLYLVFLYTQDLFLVPYWMTLLKHASPLFYVGLSCVLLGVAAFLGFRMKKTLKRKKVVYQAEEERHVEEMKTVLTQISGSYETDLDKLYALLQQRQMLRVTEVAKAFSISKEEAEEWGKILKEQDLAELYYPAVGEMEIRWKKSKSTAPESAT